ncbi:MAG: dTMP kinase [Phycisphaerae bacterium]
MENEIRKMLASKVSGKFIVMDGPDGCGKSTQIKLLADHLSEAGIPCVTVHDPGDTAIGDAIRKILLGLDHEHREIRCELLLFMASRAQLVSEKIKPALAADKTVLCDRYVSSSFAYQGAGGLDIKPILDVAKFATQQTWPDLTIVLDVTPQMGFQRIKEKRNLAHDAMERRSLDYHQKVRDIFLKLEDFYPKPVKIVDAADTIENVRKKILEILTGVDY